MDFNLYKQLLREKRGTRYCKTKLNSTRKLPHAQISITCRVDCSRYLNACTVGTQLVIQSKWNKISVLRENSTKIMEPVESNKSMNNLISNNEESVLEIASVESLAATLSDE